MRLSTCKGKISYKQSSSRQRTLRFVLAIGFIATLFWAQFAVSAETTPAFDSEKTLRIVKRLESTLNENTGEGKLKSAIEEINGYQQQALHCIASAKASLQALEEPLAVVGESTEGDSDEIIQQRRILAKQKSDAENLLSECQLLSIQADKAKKNLSQIINARRASELFAKTPPAWKLLTQFEDLKTITFDKDRFIATSGLTRFTELTKILLYIIVGLSLIVGFWLRASFSNFDEEKSSGDAFIDKLMCALIFAARRYIVLLVLMASISIFFYYLSHPLNYFPFITALSYGVFACLFLLFINQVLLEPVHAGAPLVNLPPKESKSIARQLNILSLVLLGCFTLYILLQSQPLSSLIIYVIKDILITILVLHFLWLLWLVARFSELKKSTRIIRAVSVIVLFAVVIYELLGYRNFSEFLLISLLKTYGLLFLFWLVTSSLKDLFEGIAEGTRPWHHNLRQQLGLKPNVKEPSIYWLNIIINLFLWTCLALLLLRVWGMTDTTFGLLSEYFVSGFSIAETTITPVYIISGVVTFVFLLFIFRLIRDKLIASWLLRTGVERGAREAVNSIMGYTGFVLAVILALMVAGLNFSNLTILASAFALGIGIGLQDVVKNFVSGLILLFERPVKTGDWVVVGQTEGYVKKISIRSTHIQTFDRSDIMVPNSDMTSQHVTNWMLREHYGRVRITIGVAYDSDTELVRKVLLEIAENHPEVITNGLAASPAVLFLEFGDSALLFELRAMIFDIDKRTQVTSDINFAIDRAFRNNNIEIPFPQRDLHIKSMPDSSSFTPKED